MSPGDADQLESLLFVKTPTLGVRTHEPIASYRSARAPQDG